MQVTRRSAQSVVDQSCIKMAATLATLPPNFSFTWKWKFTTHPGQFEIGKSETHLCQINQVSYGTTAYKYPKDWFFRASRQFKPEVTFWDKGVPKGCDWDNTFAKRGAQGLGNKGQKQGGKKKGRRVRFGQFGCPWLRPCGSQCRWVLRWVSRYLS